MITHDRPGYTRKSLRALCESLPEGAKAVVWDNASGHETKEVLKEFESHPKIEHIVYHPTNDKLSTPTNWFWEYSRDADLVGKVDDDCVVPSNWCEVLSQAHRDIPNAGAIACWHFLPEDFDELNASKKIKEYRGHSLLRNCWVCGSGYLMKRKMVDELGLLRLKESFSGYCIRAAKAGYIHGWYYPFIYQIHLDDPRVSETGILSEEDFQKRKPLSAQTFEISSRDDWVKRLRHSAKFLQTCSVDPSDYVGWKPKIKRRLYRLFGKKYEPTVSTSRILR